MQGIGYECFQVLHPWAYDLDSVDLKYIVNTSVEQQICSFFKDNDTALIFWMSFFKSQLACSADEFVESLRQLAEMNGVPGMLSEKYKELNDMMASCNYVITCEKHSELIINYVTEIEKSYVKIRSVNSLFSQFKLYDANFIDGAYVDRSALERSGY